MKEYDPKEIEKKWQEEWEKSGIYRAENGSDKPKQYILVEFPFPSGDGLHAGHVRSYTALDAIARKRRRQGFNVLYPIGWDAFGLPTENYAIKVGKDPKVVTKENTDNFRRQLKSLGISFDWSREVNTTDPAYYKWTQWIFLKFLEKGLAYKAKIPINWCPKDKIGLANEEVIDGKCERCGTQVEKREKEQWMLAITKYADRLVDDLEDLDYPERVKAQQINWIGRSEGAEIDFPVSNSEEKIRVFTTRPDTIFGATYMVIAPEHELVQKFKDRIENWKDVEAYIAEARKKTDIDRSAEGKEKTGVELRGIQAINPANKEEIPVYIADYVLPHYGTGAIMAVPAHDERDWEFAKRFNLEIRNVIEPVLIQTGDSSAFRPDEPMQDSDGIIAIVKHWSEDKYLGLTWTNAPGWGTFLTGGIDDGLSPEETVLKEIKEETGYKNARIVSSLGVIHGKYYHVPKKLNRFGHAPTFVVELEDGERDDLNQEEASKHELHWLSIEELRKFLTPFSHQTALEMYTTGVYSGTGLLANSGEFNGLQSDEAKRKIAEKFGSLKTTFKLRDWVFSRQRYWGEPIPVVHCETCGIVPVTESELPVTLPEVKNYQPTDTGESPLSAIDEWVNTTCPKCSGKARRETDTMPNWAGSSWYYLRYADPHNDRELASKESLNYWTPVDWYNGGMEHTVLHLLYSRFWHKFLFDLGIVPTNEPYKKRTSHGLVLAEGGVKMSKSLGNVVNPDTIIERFGADTLRLYEMFMGPFEQAIAWSEESIVGPRRFIEKVWRLKEKIGDGTSNVSLMHQTIKKVSEDVEMLGFNTAIASLMIFANDLEKREGIPREEYETLVLLLAPFAPHVSEELWKSLGNEESVHIAAWPSHDESKLVADTVVIAVQVNGKVRAQFSASRDVNESEATKQALELPEIGKWTESKEVKKIIFVPNKLVSIVTS